MNYKLIILDLDGTITEPFIGTKLYPDVLPAIPTGTNVAIATNQGGIGLRAWMEEKQWGQPDKYPTCQEVAERLAKISEQFSREPMIFVSTFYQTKEGEPSPILVDYLSLKNLNQIYRSGPEYRKPEPGLLLDAMAHYKVGPAHTLMVGDMDSDKEAAERAGCGFMWADEFFGRKSGE